MSMENETSADLEVIEQMRSLTQVELEPSTDRRIRASVFARIQENGTLFDWLLRPLWRPVLAALLPFATGLAFGQSHYLDESALLMETERSVKLVSSLDAAHSLLEIYAIPENEAHVD